MRDGLISSSLKLHRVDCFGGSFGVVWEPLFGTPGRDWMMVSEWLGWKEAMVRSVISKRIPFILNTLNTDAGFTVEVTGGGRAIVF